MPDVIEISDDEDEDDADMLDDLQILRTMVHAHTYAEELEALRVTIDAYEANHPSETDSDDESMDSSELQR